MPDILLAYILTIEKKDENPARIFNDYDLGGLYSSNAERFRL